MYSKNFRYFFNGSYVVELWNGSEWEYCSSYETEQEAIDCCECEHDLNDIRDLAYSLGFSSRFVERFIDTVSSRSHGLVDDAEYDACVDYLIQAAEGL